MSAPPLIQLLEHQATIQPERPAFMDDRSQVTWSEFAEMVWKTAAAMKEYGLSPGERVGVHGLNSIELAVFIAACWHSGLVTVHLSPFSKGPELVQELAESGAAAYLCDSEMHAVAEPVLEQCSTLRIVLLLKRGEVIPEIIRRPPAAKKPPQSNPHLDVAAILFSSGTTGTPKGVVHTHSSLAAMGQPAGELSASVKQHILVVAPLGYITSLCMFAQCLSGGHSAMLMRRFDPNLLLDAIAEKRCTYFFTLPPAGCQLLLAAQKSCPRDTRSIRFWPVGGDSFPRHLLETWRQFFGLPLHEGYALTEFFPAIGNHLDRNRTGSIGEPWPGVEVRLVTESGSICKVDETGEIQLKGPMMFAGYWNDMDATRAVFQDGWFRTGDLASRDADGYYWFRGRLKQIISCDGEKISPQHVENALTEHPDVLEAGVVGRSDEEHGEVPVAFVRLRPSAEVTDLALLDFVRERVEDSGVPHEIRVIDAVPRTRTGKVDRRKLKEALSSGPSGFKQCPS